uniref:Glutathione S-transferase C-terminal domain-containing protein n=1 Tax=Glossina palpalis gambiensis TaxID=67801 RepID=A0A1B0C5H9_9MUSC
GHGQQELFTTVPITSSLLRLSLQPNIEDLFYNWLRKRRNSSKSFLMVRCWCFRNTKRLTPDLMEKPLNCTCSVGERITLCDIIVFCSLLHATGSSTRKPYGNTCRWFMTSLNQP